LSMSVLRIELRCAYELPEGAQLVVHELRLAAAPDELPVASLQRVLGHSSLVRGMHLQLFRPEGAPRGQTRILAWVEYGGGSELEFDGVRATPGRAALVGTSAVDHEAAIIVLQPVPEPRRVVRAA
jgi:hypothetical protein